MIELSRRLQAVAEMVTPGNRLADIGTDHGYIPIYLAERGIIPSAIAMDIKEGPLMRAKEHIEEQGLDSKIQTRLSNGLLKLQAGEVDTMIAAGMGGALVIRILEEGETVADSLKEFILQPQSELKKVRMYLCSHHYRISEEDMVLEEGKFYPMMKVVHGETEAYTEEELMYGRFLLRFSHPVLKEFLQKECSVQETILQSLSGQDSEKSRERKIQVRRHLEWIREILKSRF